jgi:hypothetical protein
MPRRTTALGRRKYGGDTADGPPVRGVRARTAALTPGCLGTGRVGARGSRDGACLGQWGLGQRGRVGARGSRDGARPAAGGDGGAHDIARGGALPSNMLLVPCSNWFFSKILNRTGPSDEYQSCRSSYQQQFLQKPYRVFLPRSEVI